MYVEVKLEIDSVTIDIYKFILFDTVAVFIEFGRQCKPKGMKVWKYHKLWDKYNKSACEIVEPALSNYVRDLAKEEVIKKVQVKTWFEYEGK